MSADQLTYIGAALGVAVLVLALVLLTFCRIKCRRAAFALGRTKETHLQISYTTMYLYWVLSFLSLQTKTKAPMNVQETLGRTASFPLH